VIEVVGPVQVQLVLQAIEQLSETLVLARLAAALMA